MKLSQGQAALPSIIGTSLSFIYVCLVLAYAIQKFDVLQNRRTEHITLAVRDNHFSDNDSFKGSQGFNVAIALTGFDSVREDILLPEYGNIKFEYAQWEV